MQDIKDNEFGKIKASPAARRVAKELGIDLAEISATGIEGRIQLEDVEKHHEELLKQNTPQKDVVDEIYEIIRAREEINSEKENDLVNLKADMPIVEEEYEEESVEKESVIEPQLSGGDNELASEEIFDDHDEDYEEADDFEFSIPPLPVYISFAVPDESIKNMLTGMDMNIKNSLMNVVVKACCCALRKTDSSVYEDKVNIVTIKGKEFESKTVVNAQDSKISEIKFIPFSDADDISINIWDLTNFGFTGFKKADIDTLNIFILCNDEKIIVELACDEYIMDVIECAELMDQLKKFLINPSYMLL